VFHDKFVFHDKNVSHERMFMSSLICDVSRRQRTLPKVLLVGRRPARRARVGNLIPVLKRLGCLRASASGCTSFGATVIASAMSGCRGIPTARCASELPGLLGVA
jgi:hypothetical protein